MLSIADQLAIANGRASVQQPTLRRNHLCRRFRGLGGEIVDLMSGGQVRDLEQIASALGRLSEEVEPLTSLLASMKVLERVDGVDQATPRYVIRA